MNILLIVASGKSSRFGGFPKAFCQIGEKTNVENTIQQARQYFDKIYLGVNRDTYQKFCGNTMECEMFSIITGQGDAHSMLKCFSYIKEHELHVNQICVCWGDAVFLEGLPFKQLMDGKGEAKVAVACAVDERPYAWFETDNQNGIVQSHFAKEDGFIKQGLHDQSLFAFDFDFALKYLNEYRVSLGIPFFNDESNLTANEMKLLFSFEYLYKTGYDNAKCVIVDPDKVLSFNTQEELNEIKERIK